MRIVLDLDTAEVTAQSFATLVTTGHLVTAIVFDKGNQTLRTTTGDSSAHFFMCPVDRILGPIFISFDLFACFLGVLGTVAVCAVHLIAIRAEDSQRRSIQESHAAALFASPE